MQVDSHHHPSQKLGILNTLATRAVRIADKEHINGELKHLRIALKNNGYDNNDITRAFKKAQDPKVRILDDVNESIVVLPYIQGTTDRVAKILIKRKIKIIYLFQTHSETCWIKLKILLIPSIRKVCIQSLVLVEDCTSAKPDG